MSRICITGIGIISPIGLNYQENLLSLRNGARGIGRARHLHSRYASVLPLGEVALSNDELQGSLRLSDPSVTRTTLLAMHAFEEAVSDAGLDEELLCSPQTALTGADTVGGMCLTDEMYRDANLLTDGSPFLLSYDYASINIYIQKKYGLKGPLNTINTACSSSANAIIYGARLIQTGRAKRAIAGGCDSLAKFTVNGFNALGILSPDPCTPFDEARKGLNLGEGAAFLVLEREEDCQHKKKYGVLSGFCNTNDAFHPSSLSDNGHGPFSAMHGAILRAGIDPGEVDFINTHGTGTENNDLVESVAIKRLFDEVPDFISTKANTGHLLGAAGAVEAAFSLMNIAGQETFKATGFTEPVRSTGLRPCSVSGKKKISHVLSNSFGFGGNCTSLLFSRN